MCRTPDGWQLVSQDNDYYDDYRKDSRYKSKGKKDKHGSYDRSQLGEASVLEVPTTGLPLLFTRAVPVITAETGTAPINLFLFPAPVKQDLQQTETT